ncbi:major capsid protein [Nocardia farcinica]|uniref:major capsid protein n=1 Tax=Nocardia farcinica TaxID=37329 RepID=UPI0015F124BC|nr:major capsid protein [Nocardia farcinica]MBA4858063.1 major capsid protein [Nocardia farcinica]MBC9819406.1 major capsid protein [Nocardia farcinica]
MEFELPADLGALTKTQLEELLTRAESEFDAIAKDVAGEDATVSAEALARMKALNEAAEKINGLLAEQAAAEQQRLAEAQALVDARAARQAPAEDTTTGDDTGGGEPDSTDTAADEVVAEAETIAADAAVEPAVTASAGKPTFKGLAARTGKTAAESAPKPTQIGFHMRPQVHGHVDGIVGYRELAAAIEKVNSRNQIVPNRAPHRMRQALVPLSLATLEREFAPEQIVTAESEKDFADQVDRIIAATEYADARYADDGALVASAHWCSPSETIYSFCDVDPATGLLSLPDMNITRGGLRRPQEPDFSALYNTLPWRFTEAELMEDPTKPCIEIPCVDMEEIRLQAIGLCVTAGILQRRGWPELIERFMKEVMKAYQIKLSVWSILDMVAGSTSRVVPPASVLGATGSFLNSLALRAAVIRQKERKAHDAPIEGVTEAWMLDVAKADMANQQGRDVKSVTDQQVDQWLADRNIFMQWVQHWQPLPEASVVWPTSVQVLLYPRGTWYRHLSQVIEVGTLYDKAMLQKNRYTELFVEDEYLVDKRCLTSEVITVPLCANGAVGARAELVCSSTTNEVQTVTITGSPTGGHFTLTFRGHTTDPIAHNAGAAHVQLALAMLPSIGAGNAAVSGVAGGPYTVTFQGVLGATALPELVAADTFTGGTDPGVTVAQSTAGAPNTAAA